MSKVMYTLLIVCSLFNCIGKEHNKKAIVPESLVKNKEVLNLDTILSKEVNVNYINLTPELYLIEWGKASFKNTSKDTIHVFPSGKLRLDWYNNDIIMLRQGCGTACFFAYILPLKPNSREKLYWYPLASDTANNLIAYNGNNEKYYNNLVIVENLITGKKKVIKENFLPGPFPGTSIDSITFINKELYIKWKDNKNKIKSKKFGMIDLIKK